MNRKQREELRELLLLLLKRLDEDSARVQQREEDLVAARRIAGEQSRQTGKNYQNFESDRYDHAFGVRTALAAIKYGRKTAVPPEAS